MFSPLLFLSPILPGIFRIQRICYHTYAHTFHLNYLKEVTYSQMQFGSLHAIMIMHLPFKQRAALGFMWGQPKIDLSKPWWPKNYHTKFKLLDSQLSQCHFLFCRKESDEIIIEETHTHFCSPSGCSKQHFNDSSVNESEAYGLDFP